MSLFSTLPFAISNKRVGIPIHSPTFQSFIAPLDDILPKITPLTSRSNRPITFTFDYQLKSLIYYHLEECTSAQGLLQMMADDEFARQNLIPEEGLGESTFYEANANRGAIQMLEIFDQLGRRISLCLGDSFPQLGDLVAIDGSLIDATLSMTWADYSTSANKVKVHIGLSLNRNLPRRIALTTGNGAERPFVSEFLAIGQTGVVDRGYQDHQRFDEWIDSDKHFVARLKKNTRWGLIQSLPFIKGNGIFFFGKVRMGDKYHRMRHPVYLVGLSVGGKVYWVATDRQDLSAEEIAFIYSLRWRIETLFGWWKRHLKVYHLISRNPHGVLLQLLAGLITYLLFLLHCVKQYGEKRPSIRRLRQLRWQIRRETGYVYQIRVEIHLQVMVLLIFPNISYDHDDHKKCQANIHAIL